MADNSYNIMVSNPVTPFTMARSFKACSNGKIFIGKPDTDPTVSENQLPVFVENEDGSTVQVAQPLVINSAGYPVYNGQAAKFVTTQNHSMAVYDSYMVQQFYWGDLSKVDPNSVLIEINNLRNDLSGKKDNEFKYPITGNVWVESFANGDDLTIDARAAFERAAVFAEKNNSPYIYFEGNYTISTVSSVPYTSPYDDGTVSPSALAKGDTNLTPEVGAKFTVGLNLPYGVGIRSLDVNKNSLTFKWPKNVNSFNNNYPIAIVCRVENWDGTYTASVGAKNRMTSETMANFSGFNLKNAMVGILYDGISFGNKWPDEMLFTQCGIPVISQGTDIASLGRIRMSGCAAGICIGGHWLTRNVSTIATNMPPYDGSVDVNAIGWIDAIDIESIQADFPNYTAWSDVNTAVDNFFDTYFFKSTSNSRATTYFNNGSSKSSAILEANKFRGVASRLISFMSRYGRSGNQIKIDNLKSLRTFRPPVYAAPALSGGVVIDNSYIERLGFSDMTNTSSSDFFGTGLDAWNSDLSLLPATVCQGLAQVHNLYVANSVSIPPASAVSSNAGDNGVSSPNQQQYITLYTDNTPRANQVITRGTMYGLQDGYKLSFAIYGGHAYFPVIDFENRTNFEGNNRSQGFYSRDRINQAAAIPIITADINSGSVLSQRGGAVSYRRIGTIVEAFYTLFFADIASNTGTMFINTTSIPSPVILTDGTVEPTWLIPTSGTASNKIGPNKATIQVSSLTAGFKVIPAACDFVVGSAGTYLVLYTDIRKTTTVKCSDILAGSTITFSVKYTTTEI